MVMVGCGESRKAAPPVVDGKIDLSSWDFEKDGIVELDGQWLFVWGDFVQPQPSQKFRESFPTNVSVPEMWPDMAHPDREGEMLPGKGYATYFLEIRLPEDFEKSNYMLSSRMQGNAARYIVADPSTGKSIAETRQGIEGKTRETTVPLAIEVRTRSFTPPTRDIQIWFHLSSFHHYQGGTWNAVVLGLSNQIVDRMKSRRMVSATVFGICLIIALYHFVLYLQRREDTSALVFGLLCGTVALRQWSTGRFSQSMGWAHTADGYEWLLSAEYMTMPVMSGCTIKQKQPKQTKMNLAVTAFSSQF